MLNVNVEGVELELRFSELSAEIQKRLYLQDKEKIKFEAASSNYDEVRELVISDKDTSPDILERIFNLEMVLYKNKGNILKLLKHPNLQKKEEKKRQIVDKEMPEVYYQFLDDEESSSELLNCIVLKEIERLKFDRDLIEILSNNKKFKMEERTVNTIIHHFSWEIRCEAAIAIKDREILNLMLEAELEGDENSKVIESLLENENIQLDKEKRLLLLKAGYSSTIRTKLIRDKNVDSQTLNEYLREEVKRFGNSTVMDLIRQHENFEMELETLKVIASCSDYPRDRMMVFEYENLLTLEFLEDMYSKEDDEDIRRLIENKVMSMFPEDSIKLNMIQKIKILRILKDLRNSNYKVPLTIYLKKILDVLN